MQKEISFLQKNERFKLQINLDRRGLRPLTNVSHLPDPISSRYYPPLTIFLNMGHK
jgi:hypothetical protein